MSGVCGGPAALLIDGRRKESQYLCFTHCAAPAFSVLSEDGKVVGGHILHQ